MKNPCSPTWAARIYVYSFKYFVFYAFCRRKGFVFRSLVYEQHLAVLGQWPEFVVDDEFQLVDVAAYLFDERCYGVVVGNGTLSVVLDAVGNATGFDEAFHILDDEGIVFANLLDETHVGAIEAFGCLGREDVRHLMHIVDELWFMQMSPSMRASICIFLM